jgi:hypothetical protein
VGQRRYGVESYTKRIPLIKCIVTERFSKHADNLEALWNEYYGQLERKLDSGRRRLLLLEHGTQNIISRLDDVVRRAGNRLTATQIQSAERLDRYDDLLHQLTDRLDVVCEYLGLTHTSAPKPQPQLADLENEITQDYLRMVRLTETADPMPTFSEGPSAMHHTTPPAVTSAVIGENEVLFISILYL